MLSHIKCHVSQWLHDNSDEDDVVLTEEELCTSNNNISVYECLCCYTEMWSLITRHLCAKVVYLGVR